MLLSSNSTTSHPCPFAFSLHVPPLILLPLLFLAIIKHCKIYLWNVRIIQHFLVKCQYIICCKFGVTPSPVSVYFIYKKMHKQETNIYCSHSFKNINYNIRGCLHSPLNCWESGKSLQNWDSFGIGEVKQRFTGIVSSFKLTRSERTKRLPKFCPCGSNLNICF